MTIEPTLIASMDCSELERSIDMYLDDEFDVRERAEADAHLAKCQRCRAHVESQRRIREAIRAKLREAMSQPAAGARAPAALRARIEESLARHRRPLWRRVLAPVPIATLAACAAGALLVLSTHIGPDGALVEEAVTKHHRGLPLEVVAADMGGERAILAWLANQLDFHPAPPRFQEDVHLIGARLSHLREWPAAYIRYDLPRGHAGLFIVDDPHHRFDAAGREVKVGPNVVRLVTARGYNVAVWRDDEIVYSLVADLDEAGLFELVRTAQAQAQR